MELTVNLGENSYPIYIENGILPHAGEYISKFYHEKNGSYEIIQEMHINDDSIVIGYSPTSPAKFVTWETNGNRKYGFYTGHYFNDYEEAYKDMEKRSKYLLEQNLCRKRNFLRKNKINQER